MSGTGPNKGEFHLLLAPTGEVIAPDLTESLLPLVRDLSGMAGLDGSPEPCDVEVPRLVAARHKSADGFSLLDRKIAAGRRMLRSCTICEHRCSVNRCIGSTGFCGLDDRLSVSGYSLLYNEGPFVGQPTFGVFLRGCALRCEFCYRPKDLVPQGKSTMPAASLAAVLDEAAAAGAQSWHFLGGNPDESLVGVLEALRLTTHVRPVVWNSALYLSSDALSLLKGVVDIWLPDLKFGNDKCANQIAGVPNYSATVRRNLLALTDEPYVAVRHMHYPGHEVCCGATVRDWLDDHLPNATVHDLQYHPVRRVPVVARTSSWNDCDRHETEAR